MWVLGVWGDLNFSPAGKQGIEKKRSTLHGSEKSVVARHEAGHAVVGTAVAKFIPGQSRVQVKFSSHSLVCSLEGRVSRL